MRGNMPSRLTTILVVAGAVCGCKMRGSSDIRNLSATADFYDVVIPDGLILADMPDGRRPGDLEDQIRDQLKYFFVGQLKGRGAGSDFNRAEIQVLSHSPSDLASNAITHEAHYTARFTVAWPKGTAFPKLFSVMMPAAASGPEHEKFLQTFDDRCAEEKGQDLSNPWHYRPENTDCPLAQWVSGPGESHGIMPMGTALVARARLTAVPQVAKDDKSPEYDRIWEDGVLEALLIYGKDTAGSTDASDIGAQEFNRAHFALMDVLGKSANGARFFNDLSGPWPKTDSAELVFERLGPRQDRTVRVRMLVVDSIDGIENPDVIRKASRGAEYVYYGGHSGYGRHIRGLVDMLDYPAGLYRLYHLDGCNSFDYLNAALNRKVAEANPGSPASKYADVVSNALPAPFGVAPAAAKVIIAMVGSAESYRQILADIDADTLTIVEGEEDNGSAF